MTDDILTIREVADYLKVTERTLYRLAQEGKIPAFKVGGAWRFRRGDLEQWIKSQSQTEGEAARWTGEERRSRKR
ncbi:MAG: methylation-associated defense system helix-turn-helix domain-containing protein MAD1 [Acidobacteriota bacterium]